jgi:parallel beta-helix repeat protein
MKRGTYLNRKYLAVGIILLLIGTCIIPSATSELTNSKKLINVTNIITVDDEPGDADFTSIKEAVIYSNPGDTIEVYSGTYLEQGIHIENDNIALLGISHELGEGNDTGKPYIKGNGTELIIMVEASNVIVSNFTIENTSSMACVQLGPIEPRDQNNNTISDCTISNSTHSGIFVGDIGRNIIIINNKISHCSTYGICASRLPLSLKIKGNIITDCKHRGIFFSGDGDNISYNTIRRCNTGISVYCGNNIVYGNDIEDCSVGVISNSLGDGNTITKNNFKNCSLIGCWWERTVQIYLLDGIIKGKKDIWMGNYWDAWNGVGSKKILGKITFILGVHIFSDILIMIPIPWVDFDRHPAKEPYDIP